MVELTVETLRVAEPSGSWPWADEGASSTELIGSSVSIAQVRQLIEDFGPADTPVLILGETGTGKELVAQALHRASDRAGGPFVAVNCAAISPSLFESELFGSVRGAYTGAIRDHTGLVGAASGGALFLDEIGELGRKEQAKLLRLLDSGSYRPVGSTREVRGNARVIAATNRDLLSGERFRSDLYYRLDVLRIPLPPLRERPSDIQQLVDHFLRLSCRGLVKPAAPTPQAMAQLMAWDWPGNVRELRHAIERAVVRRGNGTIEHFDLGPRVATRVPLASAQSLRASSSDPSELAALLERHQGRLAPVAQELGVSIRTVQRRMKKWNLQRRDFRSA